MGKPDLPKDFDWVTARKACSFTKVHESLLLATKKYVEAMAETGADGKPFNRFVFTTHHDVFSVVRESWEKTGVRVWISRGEAIVAEYFGVKADSVTATLTLNDDGECRLLVNGQELQEWQFLKRVLEPLFFQPDGR